MEIYDKQSTLEYITDLMSSREITIQTLADFLSVSVSALCRKLKGNREFTLNELLLVCEFFGIPLNKLIQYKEGGEK